MVGEKGKIEDEDVMTDEGREQEVMKDRERRKGKVMKTWRKKDKRRQKCKK